MLHNTGTTSAPTDAMALSVEGPQPVWKTLNEARERAFTGEIVFDLDPEVHAYLDHGIVYYAERSTDAPLGRRLLDAGVLDAAQLERGTVRVGEVEHLGRLFDRDPSVERDAVVVVAEGFTEELVTELANGAVTTVRATAYRHHPSGVHRWFVAPFDAAAQQRPVSAISQIDTFAIDELPALPFSDLDDELTIEWDEPLVRFDDRDDEVDALDLIAPNAPADDAGYPTDVFELSLELAEYVDDVRVEQTIELIVEETAVEDVFDVAEDVDDAHDVVEDVVDTSAEDAPAVIVVEDVDAAVEVAEWTVEDVAPSSDIVDWSQVGESGSPGDPVEDRFELVWPDAAGDSDVDVEDDTAMEFEMPPLVLDEGVVEDDLLDEADSTDVSDDVADAVRRAIAAIESASVAAAAPAPVESTDEWHAFDVVGERVDAATTTDALPVIEPEMPAAPVTTGFAPPTMDMRAEVLYQQSSDDELSMDHRGDDVASQTTKGSDRTSALRRLIGGLRRAER